MKWTLLAAALVACGNKAHEPDHRDEIAQTRALSEACWHTFERTQSPLNWKDTPDYVALRPPC